MRSSCTGGDFSGKSLIAMPGMGDSRFQNSVVFLCSHSADGAMGLIINKPADGVFLGDLLTQLSLPKPDSTSDVAVHYGGPVEVGRGFVLHSSDYHSGLSGMRVNDEFEMTSTVDILEDVAQGNGPSKALFALGYAGWSGGQLEAEIAQNGWLIGPASHDLVFDASADAKWSQAVTDLGVDPAKLSITGGRA